MSTQVLVDAILTRTKRGPYNKVSKLQRRQRVKEMYFDQEHSVIDVANTLGVHRNTVACDVAHLRNEFKKFSVDEINDFYFRKKSMFARQRLRLEERLKTESDSNNQNKLEKILLSLTDTEIKFYTKIKPVDIKSPKPGKKLIKKIIRELAFAEFAFFTEGDLIKAIIKKTKCDVDAANSIVKEMQKLGLNHTRSFGSDTTYMIEFAKMCGYLSAEEASMIKQKRIQREEQEEREYQKRLYEYNKKFEEKFGDSKDWSAGILKKYKDGFYRLN